MIFANKKNKASTPLLAQLIFSVLVGVFLPTFGFAAMTASEEIVKMIRHNKEPTEIVGAIMNNRLVIVPGGTPTLPNQPTNLITVKTIFSLLPHISPEQKIKFLRQLIETNSAVIPTYQSYAETFASATHRDNFQRNIYAIHQANAQFQQELDKATKEQADALLAFSQLHHGLPVPNHA